MPQPLAPEEAAALGVRANHERMDNGELRFRLNFADGTALIRTEATDPSGWQNSHYHKTVTELNIVQAGTVLYVELLPDGLHTRLCKPGEHFLTEAGIRHNSYFTPGTVVLTVKYGPIAPGDWYADTELDRLVRDLPLP